MREVSLDSYEGETGSHGILSMTSFVSPRTLSPKGVRTPTVQQRSSVEPKKLIPTLLTVDLWSSEATVVIGALEELGHLCHPDEPNAADHIKLVHNLGGHLAYTVTMKKWNYHTEIQFRAICAIGVAGMDAEYGASAVKVGAIESIIVAMKNFQDDEYIQLSGCGALVVLSAKEKRNAEHLVLDLRAPSVVIRAVKNFPDNTILQGIACELLLSLTEYESLKDSIVKSGGLRALGYIVEAHTQTKSHGIRETEEAAVRTIARKAMQNLLER